MITTDVYIFYYAFNLLPFSFWLINLLRMVGILSFSILAIVISLVLAQGSEYEPWLRVPTSIPFGLFTSSAEIRNISLIRGSCRRYVYFEDERCKFYGDCCAMAPTGILERLPQDTFSCHNGYYIIDRCPSGSDPEMAAACEQWTDVLGRLCSRKFSSTNTSA